MHTKQLTDAVAHLPMPAWTGDREEYVAANKAWRDQISELEKEWKAWLGQQYAGSFPPRTQDLIFSKAWEQGHSSGYYEIEGCYIDYAEFADKVIELQ